MGEIEHPGAGATFVLVHGAWHGGWCWRAVAERLSAAGHRVLTPTLPGLAERASSLSGAITLGRCATEVARLIEAEKLHDIVLVGHSFGGAVVLGVVDRVPERIRHLALLDALVLESGESPFGIMDPQIVAARRRAADQCGGIALPVPPVAAFGIPEDHPEADRVRRRLTPHPISTYESPLTLDHRPGRGRPCTYIHCIAPAYAPLASSRARARRQPGWRWLEIATGHDAMITAPLELSRLLDTLAQ